MSWVEFLNINRAIELWPDVPSLRVERLAFLAQKRAFLANPRPYLREALGPDADDTLLEGTLTTAVGIMRASYW